MTIRIFPKECKQYNEAIRVFEDVKDYDYDIEYGYIEIIDKSGQYKVIYPISEYEYIAIDKEW